MAPVQAASLLGPQMTSEREDFVLLASASAGNKGAADEWVWERLEEFQGAAALRNATQRGTGGRANPTRW